MQNETLAAALLILIPLIAGIVVIYYLQKEKNKRSVLSLRGVHVEGIIFDFTHDKKGFYIGSQNNNDSNLIKIPIIRFTTGTGEWITEKYSISTSSYKQGQKVAVIYNPDNPKEFMLKDTGIFNIIYYVIGTISIAAIGYGLYNTYVYVFT